MIENMALLIPTMNRPESLERTLENFFEGEIIPDEVVVVDQSTGVDVRIKNEKIVLKYASKANMIYRYQEEPSLTKARNTAVKLSNCEIIIFSDDDVDVKKNTLKNVRDIMVDKSIAMIAGVDELTVQSNSKIGYLLGTKSYKKRHIGHVTGSMLGRFPDIVTEKTNTEWAMGFFFVVRKSLLDAWNLWWDEKLTSYAYAEDLDFSYSYYKKCKEKNLQCIMTNKVVVQHLASKEFRIPSRKHIFMYIINRAYLLYKHEMGKKAELLMNWSNICFLIWNKIKGANYKDYRDAIKEYNSIKKQLKNGVIKEQFYSEK